MENVNCPYCNEPDEINHDDGYGYEENVMHEQHCSNCDKEYGFTTEISFYYEVHNTMCKNDGEHKWKPITTVPKCFTEIMCECCWEKREPTKEEKIKYEIPSKEDYFNSLNQPPKR